jgi:DNA-binding transcriptional ArsR family regulator
MASLNPTDADVTRAAALLAEPARAAMVFAVSDGRSLPAGELARIGRLAPNAATPHLAKLVAGGILSVVRHGRYRYYRLGNPAVVAALEALAAIGVVRAAPTEPSTRLPSGLRFARSCYDHLAGALGVRVTEALVARGALTPDALAVTSGAAEVFGEFGVDLPAVVATARQGRRLLTRPCLDWSERRDHLAGALGAAVMAGLLERGWVARLPASRALAVTPEGRRGFRRALGVIVDVAVR